MCASLYHQDPQTDPNVKVPGSGEAPPATCGAGLEGAGPTAGSPVPGSATRALRLGSRRRGQEAQSTQATPKSEAGQEGQLPGARKACPRQVTQPTSSPEKCVSETRPLQ